MRIVTPPAGEPTLTLDLGGTVTTMAHGQQHGPEKAHDWRQRQGHGLQLAGESTLLLKADYHLTVEQTGAKTALGVPALEGGSRWCRHRKGQESPPGMVTMLVGADQGWPVTFRDDHTVRTGWDHLSVA